MEKINVLEILREAMDLEREGIKFYNKAEKHVQNQKVKDVFKVLAADEMRHFEDLELVFDHLCQEEEWMVERDLSEAEPTKELETDTVFDEDGMDNVLSEMKAIDLGIKAENKSIDMYKRALSECMLNEHEKGCKIFSVLIGFEKEHLRILKELKVEVKSG